MTFVKVQALTPGNLDHNNCFAYWDFYAGYLCILAVNMFKMLIVITQTFWMKRHAERVAAHPDSGGDDLTLRSGSDNWTVLSAEHLIKSDVFK
ncbi:hypothetical protein KCP69_14940 [Salmonella enterica subsp. enterica]|nr:hypothetical protein KCP69_14940 [Salmonella enterica subsp. enterica]